MSEAWNRNKYKSNEVMFGLMTDEIERFEMSKTPNDYALGREPDAKVHRLTFVEE